MHSISARILLLSLGLIVGLSQGAHALSFALTSEFDGVEPTASYATVDVTQNGADLDFSITLGGLLGSGEDLHELYFNLVGTFTGLAITAHNAPQTAYSLSLNPSVAGGAGSSFEVGVNFGNGGGPPGNGSLTFATFTLSADQALTPVGSPREQLRQRGHRGSDRRSSARHFDDSLFRDRRWDCHPGARPGGPLGGCCDGHSRVPRAALVDVGFAL